MEKISRFIASFFDIRHGIKARIFLSFLMVTMIFTVIVSLYWYRSIIRITTETILENMERNVTSGLTRIENGLQDIRLMHHTVIYESNCSRYLLNDIEDAPTADWFASYYRLYSSLQMTGTSLSRIVTGTGVFKANGATCFMGILGLPYYFPQLEAAYPVKAGNGSIVIFFERNTLAYPREISRNMYIGRTIIEKGIEKALIVSKVNERLITDALGDVNYHEGFSLMLDQEYNIVYDSVPDEYRSHKENFRRQLAEGRSPAGTESYIAFSKTSPSFGITLLSAMPVQYLRKSYQAIRIQFFLILLTVVLVEALLSMFISNRISFGLRSLEHSMEQLGDGSLAVSLPIRGDDEVARLGRSYLRMTEQIKKLMADIKEKESQKRQMEIRVLRAQVSPHFLYNSLNTIGYLALIQNAKNIHSLVSSLIDLLHGAVNVDDVLVPLAVEIHYVQSYLNVQQYRHLRQIQADYRLDNVVNHYLVPKMILQPLVENAVIHGLKDKLEYPSIVIKAYALNGNLIISVTDNGAGMKEEKIRQIRESLDTGEQELSGHGISNVHARIRLQFGEAYGLSLYSQVNVFTTLEIRLPLVERGGEQW
jgi:two-component system sensor histidine kinase YesM